MFGISSEKLTLRVRKIIFSAMLRQEVAWFDEPENKVGALCTRLSSDAADLQRVIIKQ
jgi:ATP-binding cassette subfamily B (MDR/TAP) protein 1